MTNDPCTNGTVVVRLTGGLAVRQGKVPNETSERRNVSTRLPHDPASLCRGFSPAPEGDLQPIMAKF